MTFADDKALMQRKLELELEDPVGNREKELMDIKPEEAIIITHYVSPTRFRYITLEELQSNGRMVNHIESQLSAHCHVDNYWKKYQHSLYVIVRYRPLKSNKYLRGQVLCFNRNGYLVETLDYGFTILCNDHDLWQLPKHLCNRHIEIKYGGLAGVASSRGMEWSKREVQLLDDKLKEALLLIFRIRYHDYGQLLVKSPREDEPLFNAASYLIQNKCARFDLKYITERNNEARFDIESADLNEADKEPSKRAATVLRLMELQRIKSPISDPNRKEDKQQSRLEKVCHQLKSWKRSPTLPCKQPQKLDSLSRLYTTPRVLDFAKRLSLVRDHGESSVQTALISGSSSTSSSGSIKKEIAYLESPVKSMTEPSLQLKRDVVLEDKNKKKMQSCITKDLNVMTIPIKVTPQFVQLKKDAVLESQDIKVPEVSIVKPLPASLDKEKLDRIYGKYLTSLTTVESQTKFKAKVGHKEQLLLAHSNGHVLPINGTPEKLFCEEVWMDMTNMNYRKPLHMQRYAWPHLMMGNSLVLIDGIGRGRSWCYLPMLCSRVADLMRRPPSRNEDASSFGPLAVILADSVANARMLCNHCIDLMKSYDTQMLKVVSTHDHTMMDVQLMLLDSCGILVTTVPHMKQLFEVNKLNLIDPHRLNCLIVDDYDRMLSTVPELLNESLQLLQRLTRANLQLILIAQQWHSRVFLQLIERFNHNPLLLFGDFLVAAIYGSLKIDMALGLSTKKIQNLIVYLAKSSLKRRTVIYCKNKEELVNVQIALTAAGYKCIRLDDAVRQQIHELLLVSDELQQVTQLPIRNYELLVHYSLPATWSKFSYRFHAIIDNIRNCLESQGKQLDILSYVMLDEASSNKLPRLAQFLQAHDVKLDDRIVQMVASCRRMTDRNRAFCSQILSRGECVLRWCHKRHYTINADFQRPHWGLWQPQTEVRCKLIKVYNPVHFAVMAESYKCSDNESWKATLCQSNMRKLATSLSVHMSLEKNRRPQQKLHISDICVVSRGRSYQRVRVLDLSDQRLVSVQQLDEGTELLKVKPAELFECDAKFKDLCPLAMDVRLCGLMPFIIGEGDWLPEATNWVSKKLSGRCENQYLKLVVEFSMLDTIYVREITLMQECPAMRTCVKALQLHNELVCRQYGQREEQSLKRLRIIYLEFKENQQQSLSKNDIHIKDIPEENAEKNLDKERLKSESVGEFFHRENELVTLQENEKLKDELYKSGVAFFGGKKDKHNLDKDPYKMVDELSDSESIAERLEFPQYEKLSQILDVEQTGSTFKEAGEVKKKVELKSIADNSELSPMIKFESTDLFLDMQLRDLHSFERSVKDGVMYEILADDSPPKGTTPQRKKTTKQKIIPHTISKALYCASIERNAVRPKVRWHQTLTQIELIFEQQVSQYKLIIQGNVLIYQVLETTPPQRCILNLLGEAKILSEQQHGYQLHVKLAKQNLILYWPTLLSSLSAQQHCHWLIYDTERGNSPQSRIGKINWMRYLRDLCPFNSAVDEVCNFSSDDDVYFSDED